MLFHSQLCRHILSLDQGSAHLGGRHEHTLTTSTSEVTGLDFSFPRSQALLQSRRQHATVRQMYYQVIHAIAGDGQRTCTVRDFLTDRVPTRIYNGYGEYVAPIYAGMANQGDRLFR